jgi:hypothetical protein
VSGFSRTSDAAIASAQGGGKPATGNPTPGTPQPEPPNVADRVTFVGCLQAVARRAEASTFATAPADKSASADSAAADPNAPSSSRFELTKAESATPSSKVSGKTYRLEGIDSQFSPFVGAKVEITGEMKPPSGAGQTAPPTLLVEFVQRIAAKCS